MALFAVTIELHQTAFSDCNLAGPTGGVCKEITHSSNSSEAFWSKVDFQSSLHSNSLSGMTVRGLILDIFSSILVVSLHS